MKKILILAVATILLSSAVSVSAVSNNSNKNNQPVSDMMDCINDVKNHGDYVSCVARQKLGGAVTSQAARSNIGKKNVPTATPTTAPTATPTPTVTPTSTVTPTPTTTSTPAPSPTATVTPTVTPTTTLAIALRQKDLKQKSQTLRAELEKLLDQIKDLIGSFIYLPNYQVGTLLE